MSTTVVQHPDGTRTTIRKTSGCGGCGWMLLAVFLVVAPAAWAANGSIPIVVAVLMYMALGAVVIAGVTKRNGKQRQMATPPPPPPPQ